MTLSSLSPIVKLLVTAFDAYDIREFASLSTEQMTSCIQGALAIWEGDNAPRVIPTSIAGRLKFAIEKLCSDLPE